MIRSDTHEIQRVENLTGGLVKIIFLVVLFRFILDIFYLYIISEIWGYAGFEVNLNGLKYYESILLLVVVLIALPNSYKGLSNIMLWLLIIWSYVPMTSLFALKDESRQFMYAATGFWLTVSVLIRLLPIITLPPLKEAKLVRYSFFIFLSVAVFTMIYRYLGFSINFDFAKVYDVRSVYSQLNIPFAGYLFNWLANIVNPVFFAFFFIRKRWIFVALIVSLQLLLFFTTGSKSFLFALFLVPILVKLVTFKKPIDWLIIGMSGVILFSVALYWFFGDLWTSSFLVRRVFFVPAQLSFFYYDYFSRNEFVYLSDSIFRLFLTYPYDLIPSHLIADVYFNSPEMASNTGLVGNAYMNFGFWGMAVFGLIFIVVMKLLDSTARNRDVRIGVAAIAMPTITLVNSGLLTTMLTHGLLLSILLLYLFPQSSK